MNKSNRYIGDAIPNVNGLVRTYTAASNRRDSL
jgi:hypothetical protein